MSQDKCHQGWRRHQSLATIVGLLNEYLPQSLLNQSDMKYFPKHVIEAAISDLQKSMLKKY